MEKNIIAVILISLARIAVAQDYLSVGLEAAKAKYSSYEFVNPRITGMIQDHGKRSVANFSFAYGYKYNDFRGELEVVLGSKAEFTNYHSPFEDVAQAKEVTSHRLMGNIYKDFDITFPLKPFVGAGLGLGYNNTEGFQGPARDPFEKKSNFALAYGVIAGVRYSFDKTSNVSMAYQYVNAGRANTGKSQFFLRDEQFKGKFVTYGVKVVYTKSL